METCIHRFPVILFCLGIVLSLSVAGPATATSKPPLQPKSSAAKMTKDNATKVAAAADGGKAKINTSRIAVDVPEKRKVQKVEAKYKGKSWDAGRHMGKRDGAGMIDFSAREEKNDFRRIRRDAVEEASLEEKEEKQKEEEKDDFRRMRRDKEKKETLEEKEEKLNEKQINAERSVIERDIEADEELKEDVSRGIQGLSKDLSDKLSGKKVRREFEYSPIIDAEEAQEKLEEARLKRGAEYKTATGKAVRKGRLKRDDEEEEEEVEDEEEEDEDEQEQERQLLKELRRRRINDQRRRGRLSGRLRKRQSDVEEGRGRRFPDDIHESSLERRYPSDEDFLRRYYRDEDDEDEDEDEDEEEDDDNSHREDLRQRRYDVEDDSFYRIGRDPRNYNRKPKPVVYANRRQVTARSGNEEERTRSLRYDDSSEEAMRRAVGGYEDDVAYNDYLTRAMRYADEGAYENAARMLRYADEDSKDIVARGTRTSGEENRGQLLARDTKYAGADEARDIMARSGRYEDEDYEKEEEELARSLRHSDDVKEQRERRLLRLDDNSSGIVGRNMRHAADETADPAARAMRSSGTEIGRIIRYPGSDVRGYVSRGTRNAQGEVMEDVGLSRSARKAAGDLKAAREMRHVSFDNRDDVARVMRHPRDDRNYDVARATRYAKDEGGRDDLARTGRFAREDGRDETTRIIRYAKGENRDESARDMRYAKEESRDDLERTGRFTRDDVARDTRYAKDDIRDDVARDMRYARADSRDDVARDMRYATDEGKGEQVRGSRNAAEEEEVNRGVRYSRDDRKSRQIDVASSSPEVSEAARKSRYPEDSEEKGQEASERQRRIFGILDDYIPGWKRSLSEETGAEKSDVISRKKRSTNPYGKRIYAKFSTGVSRVNRRETKAKAATTARAATKEQAQRGIRNRLKRRPGSQIRGSVKADKKQNKVAKRGRK